MIAEEEDPIDLALESEEEVIWLLIVRLQETPEEVEIKHLLRDLIHSKTS